MGLIAALRESSSQQCLSGVDIQQVELCAAADTTAVLQQIQSLTRMLCTPPLLILQVRGKQCHREELQQQLLAISDLAGQHPSSSQLQQQLLGASNAARQKSITRVSSQIEEAEAEYVIAKEDYISAAGKAAGALLEMHCESEAALLQVTSANLAAAQQIRELQYFKAQMQEQKWVVSAKVERLQHELIGLGVLPEVHMRRSSGSSSRDGPCASRTCSSGEGSSCSAALLTQQLCEALGPQRQPQCMM
jgi:hypothetical protein